DGIRDYKVTGVQTCALPILHPTKAVRRTIIPTPPVLRVAANVPFGKVRGKLSRARWRRGTRGARRRPAAPGWCRWHRRPAGWRRSEERRVGKGWGTRGARGL